MKCLIPLLPVALSFDSGFAPSNEFLESISEPSSTQVVATSIRQTLVEKNVDCTMTRLWHHANDVSTLWSGKVRCGKDKITFSFYTRGEVGEKLSGANEKVVGRLVETLKGRKKSTRWVNCFSSGDVCEEFDQ